MLVAREKWKYEIVQKKTTGWHAHIILKSSYTCMEDVFNCWILYIYFLYFWKCYFAILKSLFPSTLWISIQNEFIKFADLDSTIKRSVLWKLQRKMYIKEKMIFQMRFIKWYFSFGIVLKFRTRQKKWSITKRRQK